MSTTAFRLWADNEGFSELMAVIENAAARDRVMNRLLNAYAGELERLEKHNIQRRTAHTAASIAVTTPMPMSRLIAAHNIVGLFLEKGTKAHVITARRANALMLPVRAPSSGGSPFVRTFGPRGSGRLSGATRSGQVTFFRSVQHPGAKPYPWVAPSFKMSLPVLELLVLKAGAEIGAYLARKGEL
jgi:hypothetical protein